MSLLHPLTPRMWEALAFLALNDRWRREEHKREVSKLSIKGLWARDLADAYWGFTEAWILPDGWDHLRGNLLEVSVFYRFPDESEKWRPAGDVDPELVHPDRRLRLLNAIEQHRQEVERQHPGKVIECETRFLQRQVE